MLFAGPTYATCLTGFYVVRSFSMYGFRMQVAEQRHLAKVYRLTATGSHTSRDTKSTLRKTLKVRVELQIVGHA